MEYWTICTKVHLIFTTIKYNQNREDDEYFRD